MAFGFLGKLFSVDTYIQGAERVAALFHRAQAAVHDITGTKRLEKLLLERTKARFQKPGTHENAQRAPDGTLWAELSPKTKRKYNKDKKQKLVDSGTLLNSLMVVRRNMSAGALTSGDGGGFDIGVGAYSPARKYAGIHQYGGVSGKGAPVPARPFLGFGPSDAREVEDVLKIVLRKHGFTIRGV